jgi:hypothetical protein
MDEAAQKFGKRINMGAKQKELMEQTGLVDVQEQVFKVRELGLLSFNLKDVPSSKCTVLIEYHQVLTREWKDNPTTKIGRYSHRHWICHIEGYSLRLFTKTLGWSKEDTDDLLKRVLQELDQEDLQLYSLFYLVIGRKPTSAAR